MTLSYDILSGFFCMENSIRLTYTASATVIKAETITVAQAAPIEPNDFIMAMLSIMLSTTDTDAKIRFTFTFCVAIIAMFSSLCRPPAYK